MAAQGKRTVESAGRECSGYLRARTPTQSGAVRKVYDPGRQHSGSCQRIGGDRQEWDTAGRQSGSAVSASGALRPNVTPAGAEIDGTARLDPVPLVWVVKRDCSTEQQQIHRLRGFRNLEGGVIVVMSQCVTKVGEGLLEVRSSVGTPRRSERCHLQAASFAVALDCRLR